MGPKVSAALDFLVGNQEPGAQAVIGSLDQLAGLAAGTAGTRFVR